MTAYSRKSKKIKQALIIIMAVTLIILVGTFYRHRNVPPAVDEAPSTPITESSQVTLGKVHETAMRDGKIEWVLDADTATYDSEDSILHLNTPFITYHLKTDDKIVLKADEGKYNKSTQDIEAIGNVNAHYKNFKLETDSLLYQYKDELGRTRGPVYITGDEIELTANEMVYDHTQQKIFFNGSVRGIFHEADEEAPPKE